MTEAEWLAATDPTPMLGLLQGCGSDRKLRLFFCSCCRLMWPLLSDKRSQRALAVAEQHADDGMAVEEWEPVVREAYEAVRFNNARVTVRNPYSAVHAAICFMVNEARFAVFTLPETVESVCSALPLLERVSVSALIRDFLPNPFRSVSFDPSWLSSTVVALATGIYQEEAFDRMPILADALQDAGCSQDDVLNHCRQPGEHVRGCWVIDRLLGKE